MLVSLGTVYQHQTTFKLPISDDNMNFLAHLLVSKNDEQVMVGNFIGDFVKGSQIHEELLKCFVLYCVLILFVLIF